MSIADNSGNLTFEQRILVALTQLEGKTENVERTMDEIARGVRDLRAKLDEAHASASRAVAMTAAHQNEITQLAQRIAEIETGWKAARWVLGVLAALPWAMEIAGKLLKGFEK